MNRLWCISHEEIAKKSVFLVTWRLHRAVKRIPFVAASQRWLPGKYLEGVEVVHTVEAGPARG